MSDTFTEDSVRLKLGGDEVATVHDYEVDSGVLEVPATFSLTLGHGGTFAELAARYPPETPFELFIGDVLVQSGELDGPGTAGDTATEMKLAGRDDLRRVADSQIANERTFSERTFTELTREALDDVGLGDRALVVTNTANRKAITGTTTSTELSPAVENVETDLGVTPGDTITRTVHNKIRAEVGTTWLEFLIPQYRRAGLFLWAAHDGSFVLSVPNGNQVAQSRILRTGLGDPTSVVGRPNFQHNTAHRYSECRVYGRAGRGMHGRGKVLGFFIDEEMVALLNRNPADRENGGKRKKLMIVHDDHVQTTAQANFLARRRIMESRRAGWRLSYTVPGHTVPALRGGGRVIWQPDTVVDVVDDELGIEGPMYVESVKFRRTPQTETELHLMRIEDLEFAEEAPDAAKKKKPRLVARPGVVPQFGPVVLTAFGPSGAVKIWQKNPQGDFDATDISTPKIFR